MEPPSPLISWVNPFPSRFINRTACFPRKVSYFRESRMSPRKNKVGWSRTQKPVFGLFFFFTIRSFLQFYSRGDLGIMKQKLMNYPTASYWDWAWSDKTKAANWGSRIFASVVVVVFCRHTSHMSRRLNILWTIWKSSRIIWFLSSPWSGFRQLSTACKSDYLSSN